MGIKTSFSHSFNWHLKQDIQAGIELNLTFRKGLDQYL
jgi:hypothetical protein